MSARFAGRTRRGPQRGYNAVELIMAMTLFAIGAAGVVAMQRSSVQANYDARRLDVATALARTWQERLARDAIGWKSPGVLLGTSYLADHVQNAGAAAGEGWFVPAAGAPLSGNSPAFDLLGRDVPTNDVDMIFCTQLRLEWLGSTQSLVRAEVRVIWPRLNAAPITACSNAGVEAAMQQAGAMPHVLSTVTSLRGNF